MTNNIISATKVWFDEDGSSYKGFEVRCEKEAILFGIERSGSGDCILIGNDHKCLMCGNLNNLSSLDVKDIREIQECENIKGIKCSECLKLVSPCDDSFKIQMYELVGTNSYFYAFKKTDDYHTVVAIRKMKSYLI